MLSEAAFSPEENRKTERRRGRKRKLPKDKENPRKRQPKAPPGNEVSKGYIL